MPTHLQAHLKTTQATTWPHNSMWYGIVVI